MTTLSIVKVGLGSGNSSRGDSDVAPASRAFIWKTVPCKVGCADLNRRPETVAPIASGRRYVNPRRSYTKE